MREGFFVGGSVMYENCLIISGGEYSELPDDIPEPDHVIACDRGWKYANPGLYSGSYRGGF